MSKLLYHSFGKFNIICVLIILAVQILSLRLCLVSFSSYKMSYFSSDVLFTFFCRTRRTLSKTDFNFPIFFFRHWKNPYFPIILYRFGFWEKWGYPRLCLLFSDLNDRICASWSESTDTTAEQFSYSVLIKFPNRVFTLVNLTVRNNESAEIN